MPKQMPKKIDTKRKNGGRRSISKELKAIQGPVSPRSRRHNSRNAERERSKE